ncbi:MAG TPA: glutamate-1-semialdehyde 2,1-aminomutase [Actinomycetota bacterium]|nr:glutamate-1-semialdehyde 2,1-aminomutase [Actinomycetota bacterium]
MSDLFDRARKVVPGGVSSPARAFGAVEGDLLFAERGDGAYLAGTDGRRYIDYIQGFGSVILGHSAVGDAVKAAAERGGAFGLSTEKEIRLAELVVDAVPSIERVRFMASGTEASMTAARIARAATDRSVLVKFEGCYHGHADAFLAKAGSGVATFGVPMAKGVPEASVSQTVVLPFNDIRSLHALFDDHGRKIAALFVEPVAANMGVVVPDPGFLEAIVELCARDGALTVFDEVVTGFRVGRGGVQEARGLRPDLTMLGKVLGGGLPIGAVGGRAELMELLAPSGPVYQAGTYAAHPHAMAAGVAVLERLSPGVYASLDASASRLADGLATGIKSAGIDATVVRAGTFLCVFFAADPPRNFEGVEASDRKAFGRFHAALRAEGVLIPPSPFEAWFPSVAHGEEEIDRTIDAAAAAFASIA